MEKVDNFLDKVSAWKDEMTLLRKYCLDCGLDEEFKWMHPSYSYQGDNIVLIHNFKDYCALLYNKGVLLKDTENILIQQTEHVQSARQIRFKNLQEVIDQETTIKNYIYEAIEVEKAGLEVKMKKTSEFEMVDELKSAMDENADLASAFKALTPGRQRGYLLYFAQAKQSKTKVARIEKSTPAIMNGKGLRD